jgi:hypothetical protein
VHGPAPRVIARSAGLFASRAQIAARAAAIFLAR